MAGPETLVTSRVVRVSDLSMRAGITSIEQNRRSILNDKSRRGIFNDERKSDSESEGEKNSPGIMSRTHALEVEDTDNYMHDRNRGNDVDSRERDRERERENLREREREVENDRDQGRSRATTRSHGNDSTDIRSAMQLP